MVYGAMVVMTTSRELCSMLLPRAVMYLLLIQGAVLTLRLLEHFLFPWCVYSYNRRNPLAAVLGAKRDGNPDRATAAYDMDDDTADFDRIRAIVDYNFHKIQESWTYREKLPTLTDPAKLSKKELKTKRRKKSTSVVSPTQIVVQPRPNSSAGALEAKDDDLGDEFGLVL